jgi:hypothetical protein
MAVPAQRCGLGGGTRAFYSITERLCNSLPLFSQPMLASSSVEAEVDARVSGLGFGAALTFSPM